MNLHDIKKLREGLSMTQIDLALACGVSTKTVQTWERGAGKPEPENMEKLEAALMQRKD